VAVSALGTVYALQAGGDDALAAQLSTVVAREWTVATGLSLLVFYIYAPMCLSTIAVIRRETNGWRRAGIAAGYLFALAWLASFATYQVAVRVFG